MQYITSVERIGIVKGESRMLKRLLERRFGVLPEWASEKSLERYFTADDINQTRHGDSLSDASKTWKLSSPEWFVVGVT